MANPVKAKKKRNRRKRFEGHVEVCCHRVSFWYDIGYRKLTEDLQQHLEREAEERARECISEGCRSGDLICMHILGQRASEMFG